MVTQFISRKIQPEYGVQPLSQVLLAIKQHKDQSGYRLGRAAFYPAGPGWANFYLLGPGRVAFYP